MRSPPARVAAALLLSLFPIACAGGTPTPQPVTPGAVLTVETPDVETTGNILASVQDMLLQNDAYNEKMLSHGLGSATSYRFKFRGTCSSEVALQKAVRAQIDRFVTAKVTCSDIK